MRPHFEYVDKPSDVSFHMFERRDAHFDFDWHHHAEAELTLITHGTGRRFVGDSVDDYAAPDLVLLGPLLPHTWDSSALGEQRAVVCLFNPRWLATLGRECPELRPAGRLLASAGRGLRFDPEDPIVRRVSDVLRALPEAGTWERLRGLGDALHALAFAAVEPLSGEAFVTEPSAVTDERLRAVHHLVERRVATAASLSTHEAARVAHLSPAAFCRFFRRSTGRTFLDHLHDRRISLACRLLLETDAPILHVAADSGFENLSHFNRLFRRVRGTTPRAFRRAYAPAATPM